MNIMIFDVPAEHGGALSVLNEFYNEVRLNNDKSINWIFVVSKPELHETDNIKVIRYPWIKKSWVHRLFFDYFIAPNLAKKYKANKVVSLQNVIIPHIKTKQLLYVHNSLPFVNHKFNFRKDKILWIYQNIIAKSIIRSIKKADKVIVQTKWMEKSLVEKTGIEIQKIEIIPPHINVEKRKSFVADATSLSTFFYPASGVVYKNHKKIVEACKVLVNDNIKNFKVILTLKGDENDFVSLLFREVKEKKLPIEFVGSLTRDEVFELYSRSVLLFPSYIETFGLPMLEVKLLKGMILASDCPFSHEILDGYINAYFFDPFAERNLADLIKQLISNNITYSEDISYESYDKKGRKLTDIIIKD